MEKEKKNLILEKLSSFEPYMFYESIQMIFETDKRNKNNSDCIWYTIKNPVVEDGILDNLKKEFIKHMGDDINYEFIVNDNNILIKIECYG